MRVSILLFALFLSTSSFAQESSDWFRYPAISPDGTQIVFCHQGDLYIVSSEGGQATALTRHEAHDMKPVWSRDGNSIAFASNRYGNYDVFKIAASGGNAERLTYHSSSDYPSDFSTDNSKVLFTSSRLDSKSNQLFPSGVLPELYEVPASGGRVSQVLTTPALEAKWSPDGKTILYQDSKGYEDPLRKHHTSSVTRDFWVYRTETGKYEQLSDFQGEDLDPEWAPDGNSVYYLSEKSGTFNVHHKSLRTSQDEQLTEFDTHPVRHLSLSDDGVICFSFHGELFILIEGEEAIKVPVGINAEMRHNPIVTMPVHDGVSQMAVSPNGKEVAFIKRGEVFVSSVKEGTTKRITDTPEQERSVSFSPDGRSLLYASERNESWNLYQTSIKRDEEKYFFNSTVLKETEVYVSDKESFQASYSPDGKEVAFLEERTGLKVINLSTKAVREIVSADKNYSYADGDQHYEWSPDGKWFLVNFLQDRQWVEQAGLISSSGTGELVNLAPTGYGNYAPRWMMGGDLVIWSSGRHGMKNHGSWGAQSDVYGMFTNKAAWDQFKLTEEEAALAEDEGKDEKEEAEDNGKDKSKDKDKEELKPIKLDLEGRSDRITRLSVHSSHLSEALVAKDGSKLYYLAKYEKGYNLWETNLRTKETKILAALKAKKPGNLSFDKEGKNLYVLSAGKMSKISLADGKVEGLNVKGEMRLNEMEERAYLAEHIWRQVKKKFYRVDMQGVDWELYKKAYFAKLPSIDNNNDFAELMSEMLGELNASHTGAGYRKPMPNGDRTASLGIFIDEAYSGQGLRIDEIMAKGPLTKDESKIQEGHIIEEIDGVKITADMNYISLLNRKAGKNMLLTVYDPSTKKRWEEIIKPIGLRQERQLRYERWVKNCDHLVEELSNGKIGYVHVRGMNDASFRKVFEDALGKHYAKEGLIVDTRFNGGGWLHDDLATFLNGKRYMDFRPRGQELGSEPHFKWKQPSAVVMSESNYSDAHMFPVAYRAMGIGKLIGMPVPGTGTAVWWEGLQNGCWFGIPMVGMVDMNGEYLENQQLEPDIKVALDPEVVSQGRDQQLEEAVKELLR